MNSTYLTMNTSESQIDKLLTTSQNLDSLQAVFL